jgi:glycerophosphoryl diester phosphodiesterase
MGVQAAASALPTGPDAAALLAAVRQALAVNPLTLDSVFYSSSASTPVFAAHRGGGDEAPEHTEAAYRYAANQGLQAIEVSASTTSDGHPVCMHDLTVDRTTTLSGNVSAFTLTDLQQNGAVDYGASFIGPAWRNQPVPTLQQALAAVSGQAVIFLEPKDASSRSITAIFRVLDRFPTAKIVWKFATPGGGGLPQHAQMAAARGYKLWSYLTSSNPQVDIDGAAASADLLGAPTGSTDIYLQSVVAAAAVRGKRVMCWEVHRRSEVTRLLGLGVTGMMCSGPAYVMSSTALTTASAWGSGLRAAGELSHDTLQNPVNAPTIDTANRAVILPSGNRSLLLGSLSPVANAAGTYTISFAMRWAVLPGSTLHSDLIFGHADDSPYQHQVATNVNGYHLVVRQNGQVQLFTHTTGTTTGVQIGSTLTTTAPVAGAWLTFTVQVTPTQIVITRTDDVGPPSVTVTHSLYRGGYLHLATGNSDQSPAFRDVVIT